MNRFASRRSAGGFTLVELMIAIVLGLIVSGAALTVFLTNRQTYAATESLGRIQENARTGFELMARDLREAAGNDCGKPSSLTQVNVLNNPAGNWYTDWASGIVGYDDDVAMVGRAFGSGSGARVAGTDAIELHSGTSSDVTIVPDSGNNPAEIQLSDNSGFSAGDIVVACDPAHLAVFQLTNIGGSDKVVHNTGAGTPGNCSKGLGGDGAALCTENGNAYKFGCFNGQTISGGSCDGGTWPAILARVRASRWYIGNNDHGTRSLFHDSLTNTGGGAGVRTDEIAEGVQDLQLRYLVEGANEYVDADAVAAADWSGNRVVAVRMLMTVGDSERTGTGFNQISRVLEHTVTFRNRTP